MHEGERQRRRFTFIRGLKRQLEDMGLEEVIVPPMVQNPGMEPHIHSFKVESAYGRAIGKDEHYLQTSPEFAMKKLLSAGMEKIYTVAYSFRDEPQGPTHREQFLMLEWYVKGQTYMEMAKDTADLIQKMCVFINQAKICTDSEKKKFRRRLLEEGAVYKTVEQIFAEYIGLDLYSLKTGSDWRKAIVDNGLPVPIPATSDLPWDDWFFLVFLNCIEPKLIDLPLLIITEFPSQLAALSKVPKKNPQVCYRFEAYINGVEICNCFEELTDLAALKERFRSFSALKKSLYGYELPAPTKFYDSMKTLPPSSGIALGVERLMSSLMEISHPFWETQKEDES